MTRPGTDSLTPDEEAVVGELLAARKYRHVCEDTLLWAARWALTREGSQRDAVKLAKRKLHQVYGAFGPHRFERRAAAFLQGLPEAKDAVALRQHVRALLSSHPSTRERLPLLDRGLYDRLFELTEMPRKILDLACGLHPLEFLWMGLPSSTEYVALDIDRRQVVLVNAFLAHLGMQPLGTCWDIRARVPPWDADVAFALKILPSLERQTKGVGVRLVNSVRTRWVVASFPSQSLGGGKRRMGANYAEWMRETARRQEWEIKELVYPQEVFFVVRRS